MEIGIIDMLSILTNRTMLCSATAWLSVMSHGFIDSKQRHAFKHRGYDSNDSRELGCSAIISNGSFALGGKRRQNLRIRVNMELFPLEPPALVDQLMGGLDALVDTLVRIASRWIGEQNSGQIHSHL